MPETMTASEAREWLAKSEHNKVKGANGNMYRMQAGVILRRFADEWDVSGESYFDDAAPFTPYVRITKRKLREEVVKWKDNYQTILDAYNTAVKELRQRAEKAEARVKELEAENDTLRGIVANADIPCVYCGLSHADMGRCENGFPGCARADDMMLAPTKEDQ